MDPQISDSLIEELLASGNIVDFFSRQPIPSYSQVIQKNFESKIFM